MSVDRCGVHPFMQGSVFERDSPSSRCNLVRMLFPHVLEMPAACARAYLQSKVPAWPLMEWCVARICLR